jgi:hypothetical protein
MWRSGGLGHTGGNGTPALDVALDRIRYATNDEEYRAAVEGFQNATIEDPPGIFLVWPERARAVSRRFTVPVQAGLDILPTLRMWRPVNAEKAASRN